MENSLKNKKQPRKEPEKINTMVGKLLSRWKKQVEQNEIILNKVWKKVVATPLVDHTQPLQIKGRKLWVLVESASWMNELTFSKEQIKIQVQQRLAEYNIIIDEVIFKLGKD